jgi:O-antigen/teichoic acid export membrane protein
MNLINLTKNIFFRPKEFFLKNLGVKQTIFKNTFWLAVAEGVTRFLKLILIIYVARILGATEYGKFSFAIAFIGLFGIFSDFGVSQIAIRELAREPKKEKEFPAILSLKFLLGLGTLILILIASFFITSDPLIQKVIWILGVYSVVSSFLAIIFAFFRARQHMEYEAWANILQALVVTGAGFFVILNFPSIINLSYSYLFSGLVTLIFILLFFHFKVYPLCFGWQKSIWQKILTMSWPLALAGVFGTIYSQTDSVMMGYWGQITQTGWYNAASKIIGVTLIPASLISTSFFPALSLAFNESKEKLQKIWDYFMESMIFLAIPIVVGGIALAPKIIDWIYDPGYFPSILAFQILIVMAGISFLCNPFGQILVVANQQEKTFWITLTGAIVNIILNLILIPKYSLYGAAFTTLVTFFLIFFLLFKFTIKFTFIKPFNLNFLFSFIGAVISSLFMYFIISQPIIYQLNVIPSILIGAGVYLICFFIYKKLLSPPLLKR